MPYLIIDTSSILFGFSNRRDVFAIAGVQMPSHKQMVSKGVLRELSGISKNKGKRGMGAKLALESIRYKKVLVDNNARSVDSWIFNKSQEEPHTAVITNDSELYKKLRAHNIKCLKLTRDGSLR